MGCASSKQRPLCRNCRSTCSPMTRSYSMHVLYPPQRRGDTYHVVALTSTSLGSLDLHPVPIHDAGAPSPNRIDEEAADDDRRDHWDNPPDADGCVIEAKAWSEMIDSKIARTPVQTPPGEPETINAWELMAGLEDGSPMKPPGHRRCFSFPVVSDSVSDSLRRHSGRTAQGNGDVSPDKPTMWMEMAGSDSNSNSVASSIGSEFDPDVISAFRKTLEELPPATNPFHLKDPAGAEDDGKQNGVVIGRHRVVVYFTSLRGVRKTYEDCCHVRTILKGIGVRIDERDVSMHSGYKDELRELLGEGYTGGGLPRVFVGRTDVGGAEEIRRLHEEGQLEKLMERSNCEMMGGGGGGGGTCEGCGDVRFVPCETCSGSCKVYYGGEYEEEDEEYEDGRCGFQRCPDCNENGLTRCPICCN